MKKAFFVLLILLCFPYQSSWSVFNYSDVWNPDKPSPFKIPKNLNDLIKDYRKRWKRMTSFEFSGLHWNQGIVVYINTNEDVYLHNHKNYLKSLDEDEEDEDEDEEDEDEEDEDTSFSFLNYPPGTILLKENYLMEKGIPKKPVTVTMMIKHDINYDPERGNWEYIQFDTNGIILARGNSKDETVQKQCASCHWNIASRDYAFATFYQTQQ